MLLKTKRATVNVETHRLDDRTDDFIEDDGGFAWWFFGSLTVH